MNSNPRIMKAVLDCLIIIIYIHFFANFVRNFIARGNSRLNCAWVLDTALKSHVNMP